MIRLDPGIAVSGDAGVCFGENLNRGCAVHWEGAAMSEANRVGPARRPSRGSARNWVEAGIKEWESI